jgi:hypothetical protein
MSAWKSIWIATIISVITLAPGMAQQPATPSAVQRYCIGGGGVATYNPGGVYTYLDDRGSQTTGTWRGSPGTGEVMVYNAQGQPVRHDTYKTEGGQLYMYNAAGGRFPARAC